MLPLLGFVRLEGFPSSSRVIVYPLQPPAKCATGSLFENGRDREEKHDILENLVNSCLVSSHFSKES